MAELPRGTVTTLFTDVEGSTQLLRRLGTDAYCKAFDLHCKLLRAAFAGHGGHEVEMQGDSFHFAFTRASDAVLAAADAQRLLEEAAWPHGEPICVRIGIHTGEPSSAGNLYVGLDIHRGARVMAAAHGGQVLVTETTAALVRDELPPGLVLRDLGEHRLKDPCLVTQPSTSRTSTTTGATSAFPRTTSSCAWPADRLAATPRGSATSTSAPAGASPSATPTRSGKRSTSSSTGAPGSRSATRFELTPWTATRVAPGTMRSIEGGPAGAEFVVVGAPKPAGDDAEVVMGWWSD